MSRVFTVAELGGIAEGDLPTLLRQIDAAADAGCDAAKAQWLSSPAKLVERRHAEDYAGAYQNLAYPIEWLGVMRERAKARGMEFLSSVYLREDVWPLAPCVDRYKIASFEADDKCLFDTCLATGKPVILSVGMRSRMPAWVRDRSGKEPLVWPLHCVSAYPAPMDACNLAAIQGWETGEHYAGFSDHTANVLTGAFAVCAGAHVIEFHLRLDDTNPENPDYACALSPSQAAEYVRLIRLAESAMGDGIKRQQPCEADMARFRVRQG